ncbi:agaA33 [Symbiodinium pilosum]|uniref:AgaA33 protein n=1 Tax=Symbiodinium pilosum TaxID=2952 RepID=A0A812V4N4_SYMPI|nr:agaA33 [Symbiodinium pilosum]
MLSVLDRAKLVKDGSPCNGNPVGGVPAQEVLIQSGQSLQTNSIAPEPDLNSSQNRFVLGGIRESGDYKVCYCSSVLSCANPYDFGGVAGTVMVSGARTQVYVCRRGSECLIELRGWRLGPNDRLKIVAEGSNCAVDSPTFGFGSNPAWVQGQVTTYLDETNTTSINIFNVGVARVGTQEEGCLPDDVNCGYKLCYCPGIGDCSAGSSYTHAAGALRVTESIRAIEIDTSFAVTSHSLGLLVDSSYGGGLIRCVVNDGPATEWGLYPDSSFFTFGPGSGDVGWGASSGQAASGKNALTIHLTQFVEAGQILRTWCFLSDSPAYVFPPDLEGIQVAVPLSMKTPRADYLPSKGWHNSLHRLLTCTRDDAVFRHVTCISLRIQILDVATSQGLVGRGKNNGKSNGNYFSIYIYRVLWG